MSQPQETGKMATRVNLRSKTGTTKRRREMSDSKNKARKNVSIRSTSRAITPGYMKYHLAAVPNRQRHSLRWSHHGTVTVAANTYSEIAVVIMNGAYQPCAALSATSPSGFFKLMADFYTKAVVMNASIHVTMCNSIVARAAGVTQPSLMFGTSVTTNSTSLSTGQQAIQNGDSTYKMCPIGQSNSVYQAIDIGKFLGVTDLEVGTDYNCTSAANPSQVVDAHVWVDNEDAVNQVVCDYVVVLTLDTVFYDPTQI